MNALLIVTIVASVTCLGEANRIGALRNVLHAFFSEAEEWTGIANCDSPPAFLKNVDDPLFVKDPTGDDLRDYVLFGPRWSIWPTLGALYNQAQFFNESMKPALLLRIIKTDGKYETSYTWLKGSLKNPPLKRANNPRKAYGQIAAAIPWILNDHNAKFDYHFGLDCSSIDANVASFDYQLSHEQVFQGYLNNLVLTHQLQGGPEEAMEGFVIAGSQAPGQERFLTSVVSMKNREAGDDCIIEFIAAFNDNTYSENIVDYVKKHFDVTLTTDEIQAQLDKIQSC